MPKIKVAIGIPVYNNSDRIQGLINSILVLTDFPKYDYKIVIYDDGSEDNYIVKNIAAYINQLNTEIPIIRNDSNRGVPFAWNRLTEYYDTEYMVLANDDTRIINKNWLKCLVYFLDNNPSVGCTWFPQLSHNDYVTSQLYPMLTDDIDCLIEKPVIRERFEGGFFGFRKSAWQAIKQPDGSTGFWEDLIAYHEEGDFSMELARQGFTYYLMPFPLVAHFHSMTLSENPSKKLRQFSRYLSKEEYLATLKKQLVFNKSYNINSFKWLKKYLDVSPLDLVRMAKGFFEKRPQVYDSNDYSNLISTAKKLASKDLAHTFLYNNVMFAKKWHCKDISTYRSAVIESFNRYSCLFKKDTITWLDKNLEIRRENIF